MIVDGNRTIASLNELSRLAADSMEASGYSDNCGVFSEDPITASLLQVRLIELGHNTSVEIADRS